ncbi:MAG: hypothetical protein ACLQIB_17060 [Isosphaeraceae bacterium]
MGVELFQVESYHALRASSYPPDPIQIALGFLSGKLNPEDPASCVPCSHPGQDSSTKTQAVAPV